MDFSNIVEDTKFNSQIKKLEYIKTKLIKKAGYMTNLYEVNTENQIIIKSHFDNDTNNNYSNCNDVVIDKIYNCCIKDDSCRKVVIFKKTINLSCIEISERLFFMMKMVENNVILIENIWIEEIEGNNNHYKNQSEMNNKQNTNSDLYYLYTSEFTKNVYLNDFKMKNLKDYINSYYLSVHSFLYQLSILEKKDVNYNDDNLKSRENYKMSVIKSIYYCIDKTRKKLLELFNKILIKIEIFHNSSK